MLNRIGAAVLLAALSAFVCAGPITVLSGARCFNCSTGGGGSAGFTPQSNWTMTGTASDGQIVTLTYSLGGLSIPTDPRPDYWAPLESAVTKDSTYSKSTSPAFTLQTNASFQTTVKPTNATGALDQLFLRVNGSQPGSGGPTDPSANFFSTSPIFTVTNGKFFISMKRYRDYNGGSVDGAGAGLNGKNVRNYDPAYPSASTDIYVKDGFQFLVGHEGTSTDGFTLHGGSNPEWIGYFPTSSWFTDEYVYKEGTTGNVDGAVNTARNGGWGYAVSDQQWMTRPSDANLAKTIGFFSQYSPTPYVDGISVPRTPPNNAHEYMQALYVNSSGLFRVILSSETTYRTSAATSDPGVIREVQLPVASSGSSSGVQILIRKGAYSSLTSNCLYLIDDNNVSYKVGCFTFNRMQLQPPRFDFFETRDAANDAFDIRRAA